MAGAPAVQQRALRAGQGRGHGPKGRGHLQKGTVGSLLEQINNLSGLSLDRSSLYRLFQAIRVVIVNRHVRDSDGTETTVQVQDGPLFGVLLLLWPRDLLTAHRPPLRINVGHSRDECLLLTHANRSPLGFTNLQAVLSALRAQDHNHPHSLHFSGCRSFIQTDHSPCRRQSWQPLPCCRIWC